MLVIECRHYLPYQVNSWYKNFAANLRLGVGANDLTSLGTAAYGFGAAVFGVSNDCECKR